MAGRLSKWVNDEGHSREPYHGTVDSVSKRGAFPPASIPPHEHRTAQAGKAKQYFVQIVLFMY
jgi:hypothetical protein